MVIIFILLTLLISPYLAAQAEENAHAQPESYSTEESASSQEYLSTSSKHPPNALLHPLARVKNHMVLRAQRRELRAEQEVNPTLNEIVKLKWRLAPQQSEMDTVRKINLDKVFQETLAHNILIRQAVQQLVDTQQQVQVQMKNLHEPNILTLFNPWQSPLFIDGQALKKSVDFTIQAAKRHVDAVQQAALWDSAQLYTTLSQAFLAKLIAYNAVQQAKNQLMVEQERFITGDANRFDITQTQDALIQRYQQYLTVDNACYAASIALANYLSAPPATILLPDNNLPDNPGDDDMKTELNLPNPSVFNMISDNLNMDKVASSALNRPDYQEALDRQEALQQSLKFVAPAERIKKQADLHQLELTIEQSRLSILGVAEKTYSDYLLAQKNQQLAEHRVILLEQQVSQLQLSHKAGFSSAKEVLDGQMEENQSAIDSIKSQLDYHLSQIHLLYSMGLLQEDAVVHEVNPQKGSSHALTPSQTEEAPKKQQSVDKSPSKDDE